MMKLTVLNNPWLVMGACLSALWWVVENKAKIPDELEPVMMAELDAKAKPLEDGNKVAAYNWAVRNIPYYWDRVCRGGTPEQLDEWNKHLQFEYRQHEWSVTSTHRYETMSKSEVCNEREGD